MSASTDIVICHPLRTPVGAFGGDLADVPVTDLTSGLLSELVRRADLGEGDVDDVIVGQCSPNGEAPALGRIAALDAGLGVGVPGMQIDRRCGSGLMAVLIGAMQVRSGGARLVVAGGVGANRDLRAQLDAACAKRKVRVHYPELHLCTDNGAMIAMAAAMRLQSGLQQASRTYAFDVKPRWPLDAIAQ